MPSPSKSWVDIADSQVDADSPGDTTLVTALRDNLIHLEEWLGKDYTAAQNHDHDGVNSKSAVLANGVVTVAKLNLSQGTYSASTGGTYTITINRYSHMPSLTKAGSSYAVQLVCQSAQVLNQTESWKIQVSAHVDNSENFTVKWDYHA